MSGFAMWWAGFWASFADTMEYVWILLPSLLRGALMTLELFALTLALALPLALPISLGSISKLPPLRWLCKTYILIFRGTPLMLQLFFFYFFLPITMGIMLDSFTTAVLTFVLNYAAYFAEIYRAGIQSIDKGQHEAAQSLGLTKAQTMFGIIIPQMIRRVLPPVSNEAITLVKDTALVSVIGAAEMMLAAKGAVNRDVNVMAYAIAAVIYLLFTFVLTVISAKLEKHYSKHENGAI